MSTIKPMMEERGTSKVTSETKGWSFYILLREFPQPWHSLNLRIETAIILVKRQINYFYLLPC